jgi:hypothetical protein
MNFWSACRGQILSSLFPAEPRPSGRGFQPTSHKPVAQPVLLPCFPPLPVFICVYFRGPALHSAQKRSCAGSVVCGSTELPEPLRRLAWPARSMARTGVTVRIDSDKRWISDGLVSEGRNSKREASHGRPASRTEPPLESPQAIGGRNTHGDKSESPRPPSTLHPKCACP